MANKRDEKRIVMRPSWHHLLFLHWEVAPEVLRPLLPPGLELDLFEGRAFVGLIPFSMRDVRPRLLPSLRGWKRLYEDFHETNVRTYVRVANRGSAKGQDPGVWFFSLDAASLPAVVAARIWFRLPYFFARMTLRARQTSDGAQLRYVSRRFFSRADCDIQARACGIGEAAIEGTLEHFLAERYLLYSRVGKRLMSGRVAHSPYQLQPVSLGVWRENLVAAAGIARPQTPPIAFYARRVDVDIFPLGEVAIE